MFEFLSDSEGRCWFIEFNGRLWGSTALARRVGYEYPAWAVQLTLSSDFSPPVVLEAKPGVEVRHLARDIQHCIAVWRGPRTAFHAADWPSRLGTLVTVLRPHTRRHFYNYDPAAPWFFLVDFVVRLRNCTRIEG